MIFDLKFGDSEVFKIHYNWTVFRLEDKEIELLLESKNYLRIFNT